MNLFIFFRKGFFLFLAFSSLKAITPSNIHYYGGTGLWQYGEETVNTIDIGIQGSIDYFEYDILLPIFFPFQRRPFLYSISNNQSADSEFKNFENLNYVTLYINTLKFKLSSSEFGLDKKDLLIKKYHIFGSPFHHAHTPFKRSSLFWEGEFINLYTSAIQNPSLILFHYNFTPWDTKKNQKGYSETKTKNREMPIYLKSLSIHPVLWSDLHFEDVDRIDYGISLELKASFWEWKHHSLGITLSGAIYSGLFRYVEGIFYQIFNAQIDLAAIVQSKEHPYGPAISNLYSGRRETQPQEHSGYTPGILFMFGIPIHKRHGLNLATEVYFEDTSIFSIRGEYYLRLENLLLLLSYTRENIQNLEDFNDHHDPDGFIGLEFSMDILEGLLKIGFSSHLNWIDRSIFKSQFFIHFVY